MEKALRAAGGPAALARAIGVTRGAVSQWRRVPPERIAAVSRATGLAPHELDPALASGAAGFAEAQSAFMAKPVGRDLPAEALALGLDPQAIAEAALRRAISEEKARRWNEENKDAIAAHNRWVEEHGLPLAEYHMF
ncbi:MAG: type II toxin-antitoxin system CcdA family antitoxin [Acetobacteraceae bacterium]|nr:type II toxin-antitoxin system CcdA family antitoxin [Acetobacteraceae bacterium]